MTNKDGTGPQGKGPRTGRGLGDCLEVKNDGRKDFGDLFVKRTENVGGFDIYLKVNEGVKKLCFFNGIGMEALKDWLIEQTKNPLLEMEKKLEKDIKDFIYAFETTADVRVTNIKWEPRELIDGLFKMGPIKLQLTFEKIWD